MVSRRPNALCFHCGAQLEKTEIEYNKYIYMDEEERKSYRENYKKRVLKYNEKLNKMFQENKCCN